jgi:hypothetical protein
MKNKFMDKLQLEQKWKALLPDGPGYTSLRIDGHCIPDLYIGIYNITTRCLILKLPNHQKIDFLSTEKANLSIEFFRETKWIILKLLDNNFIDLFDDLILSLYGRVYGMSDAGQYSSELISTFYKWSEFFSDKATLRLSEEIIRGIFGELLVLKDYIAATDALSLNEMLGYWKGPYKNRHDFILPQKDLEVKTIEDTALDVLISSEFQLAAEPGKGLELMVVRILRDFSGISLRDLLIEIRQLIIAKLADFTIILKGLSTYGLNLRSLEDYDNYRYKPVAIDAYDCIAPDFPKIVQSDLFPAINQVSYQIRTTALNKFLLSSKKYNQ